MDARQFLNLVSEMRNKQKEYFKTHTQSALKESKALACGLTVVTESMPIDKLYDRLKGGGR